MAFQKNAYFRAFEKDVMEDPCSLKGAPQLMEEVLSYTDLEIWPEISQGILQRIAKILAHRGNKKVFHHPLWKIRKMKHRERLQALKDYFYEKLCNRTMTHLVVLFVGAHRALRASQDNKEKSIFGVNLIVHDDLQDTYRR